jgi:cbb3-type cytochrome oxidase maturation protein
MSVLYLVLPLAVLLSALATAAFLWAARRGQFDDLETPAIRILHDDAPGPGADSPEKLRRGE